MCDPRSETLVLIHELIEYILCTYYGISAEQVDKEDQDVLVGNLKDKDVSYRRYHNIATQVEMILCDALELSWDDHAEIVDEAFDQQKELFEVKK